MIIWGGSDSSRILNTGSRYNISNDSWSDISTINAPSYRTSHTAVWTGTEMIIWGGRGDGLLNTGSRYNPVTNTWISITLQGAPSAREGHTAVWTGSEMIIWGGEGYESGARYNPVNDEWRPISTLNALAGNGTWTGTSLVVWNNTKLYGSIYTPATDSWEKFLLNSDKYEEIRNVTIGPISAGENIAIFSSSLGKFMLIKPNFNYIYIKN
jgi:N-acetylneuraminic acid mutarotase